MSVKQAKHQGVEHLFKDQLGATDYDQDLHRDYLNQTVLVPSAADQYQQLEMFVFLTDVPEDLGPPHFVS